MAFIQRRDAYVIEPGHDARLVGDEPAVGFDFESTTAPTYAIPGRASSAWPHRNRNL